MSEKQRFNKGAELRQIAEKRRERWMSRKLLTEILEVIRKQRDDANWILYQVFKKDSENLKYKSKIKIWNHLMRAGYDLVKEKPEKEEILSYHKAWQEYKLPITIQNIKDAYSVQQAMEANHKLYQQLEEANEVLKQIANSWVGLAEKNGHPAFKYLEKYNITEWDK